MKHWQRALTFANLANISTSKMGPNNMISGEQEEYDLYIQNFYLYAFSKVYQDPASLHDNYDGITYIYKERVEELTDQILAFENEEKRKKFLQNLIKSYRYFNDGQIDRNGFDIDKLLQLYLDVFIEVRNHKTDQVLKAFYRDMQDSAGERVLSLDELIALESEVFETESPVPGYIYPKEMTIARSFMFSLTCGKNSFSISSSDLIAGMNRFGINCPMPFISLSASPQGGGYSGRESYFGDDGYKASNASARKQLSTAIKKKSSTRSSASGPGGLQLPFLKNPQEMKTKSDEETSSFRGQGGNIVNDGKDGKRDKKLQLDSTSTMFAQHFSILREMKNLVDQFRDVIKKESDNDVLRRNFEDVYSVLERGCHFLQFPIKY